MNRRAFLLGSTAVAACAIAPAATAVEVVAPGIPSLGTLSRAQLEADWHRIAVGLVERMINPPWIDEGAGPRIWVEQANRDRASFAEWIEMGRKWGVIDAATEHRGQLVTAKDNVLRVDRQPVDVEGPMTATECGARQALDLRPGAVVTVEPARWLVGY